MHKEFDVIAVGDLNADLILAGDVTPVFGQVEKVIDDATLTMGGSTSIFACGAARLGLRVAFIGKVGRDPIGDFLLDVLVSRSIDIEGVRRDAQIKTGLTTILSRGVDRAMLTYLGTLGMLAADDVDWSIVARARHLHLGSYYMLDALRPAMPQLFATAHAHGLTVSLDTNYDPTEQWDGGIDAALANVDIFLPNETEVKAIGRG
ncbi:MAG TPA: carbohydrate kinase, partial [Chloroflexi bacterium]|nr:carbohydrate kinase [Chloroflexota bacterium]